MPEATVPMDLFINIVRRDYLKPELARIIITEACVRAGHPAKIDRPFDLKQDWERGCVCGRNQFA